MRSVSWRPDGAGISFMLREEKDEDDPDKKLKDRVMLWIAPYGEEDKEIVYESDDSLSNVQYSASGSTMFLTKTKDGERIVFSVANGQETVISKWKSDDFYENPGTLMSASGPLGRSVVRIEGGRVFLQGTQYDKKPLENAPRPFIDAVNLETGNTARIWQSAEDMYETWQAAPDMGQLILGRQSKTVLPDSYVLTVRSGDV